MSSPFFLDLPGQTQLVGAACGPLETNAYLLRHGNHAVLIDPAIDSGVLLDQMRQWQSEGVQLQAIWNTHGHFDHVYDNARWKVAFPVPLLAHPLDEFFLEHLREQAIWFGLPAPDVVVPDAHFEANQILQLGELQARVLHLPGHSPGSVAFDFGAFIFGGDVLFQGSVGRTDLPASSTKDLANSLEILWQLPDETVIFPGHGPHFRLGDEKKSNFIARQIMSEAAR